VVVLDGDMGARLKGYGVEAKVIAPWVFRALIEARRVAGVELDGTYGTHGTDGTYGGEGAERVWLYSGNLGRAHEWRTLLDAQGLIEKAGGAWKLVFQGGGPARTGAREYAERLGLARCEWRDYVAEEQLPASLLAADVLIVTQKPETCGLLWPSKLALVTSLPRAILWVGPVDRAIARDLEGLPQAGIFAPGDAAGVAKWIMDAGSRRGEVAVRDPVAIRAASLNTWVDLVTRRDPKTVAREDSGV
jgi:hypothetical protein